MTESEEAEKKIKAGLIVLEWQSNDHAIICLHSIIEKRGNR
jgi:hypothetical protein